MACQWEASRPVGLSPIWPALHRHTATSGSPSHQRRRMVDSARSVHFDRWYDFLELFRRPTKAPFTFFEHYSLVSRAAGTRDLPVGHGVSQTPSDHAAVRTRSKTIPTYSAALAALREAPEIPSAVRQRSRQVTARKVTAGNPYPAFRKVLLSVPIPGTTARFWYLGPSGRARLRPAAPLTKGTRLVHVERQGASATTTPPTPAAAVLVGDASQWQWNWAAEPSWHGRLVRVGPRCRQHHRVRRGANSPLGALLDARCRPPGHGQRGPARR